MSNYPSIEVDLSTKIAPAGTHWDEIDELREKHRFFWNTYGPGYWVLTRFEDIREAFQSPETFCNRSIVATDPDPQYRFLPSFIDPPEHMKYRQVMNKWFAPASVAKMAPTLERLARETVEEVAARRQLRLHVDVRRTGTRSRPSCTRWGCRPTATPTSSCPACAGCPVTSPTRRTNPPSRR